MKYAHGSNDDVQAEVTQFLHTALAAIFPTSGIRAYTRTILGECDVYLRYTNAAKLEDCSHAIWENDPAYMMFSIIPTDTGFVIEAPTSHSNVLKKAGIRFVKIKGNTEMDCAVKLVAFMKKNSANFLKLGLNR